MIEIEPFLKWAGGKRWLVRCYPEHFPRAFARYHEPFVGGGAVFLSLNPAKGQLSDRNSDLIGAYKAIRSNWKDVEAGLKRHQAKHNKKHYYVTRAAVPDDAVERAIWFIYMNRTCWNGLYRVNLAGEFNVPIGTKSAVVLPTDRFEELSRRLRKVRIQVADFEEALGDVGSGDFVFIDPPYTVKHNVNGFLKYNEQIFSWADQERLAKCVESAANKGASILISQADHASVRNLYKGIGTHHTVSRPSVIAASATHRGRVTELVIRINY